MKSSPTLFLFLGMFLISSVAQSQSAEKNLVKSFNLQGKTSIVLDLGENVEVQQWNNEAVRVQMTISLTNGSESNLKALIQSGRYNMQSEFTADALKISVPALQRPARLNGFEAKESISFTVFVPTGVTVKAATDASASKEGAKDKSSL